MTLEQAANILKENWFKCFSIVNPEKYNVSVKEIIENNEMGAIVLAAIGKENETPEYEEWFVHYNGHCVRNVPIE